MDPNAIPPPPPLSPALLTVIAGDPIVDGESFLRVKPCPFTGWWKVATRFRATYVHTGEENEGDVSCVVSSPFILADVVLEAVNQAWRKWSADYWTTDGRAHQPRPMLRATRLVYMAGMSWLPQELKAHRAAVKKKPHLRRVLGTAGGVAAMTSDGTAVDVTPREGG